MAFERAKSNAVLGDDLSGYITIQLDNYSAQIAKKSAEEEAAFSKLVLEQGISLEDQLSFRQEQIKNTDDITERKRIQGEVSTLKQRIAYKQYADEYTDKLIGYESGMSSIDTVIAWLQGQKDVVTDPTTLTKINTSLSEMQAKKYELQASALKDHTDYALKDKTDEVIDKQISTLNYTRAKAVIAGRDDEVSTLDLQIQSLSQAKAANQIEKTSKNFAISSLSGYQSATGLLDSYASQIASADDKTPVTIGGTTYNSAKEYWTTKRDSYVADGSSDGFFAQFKDEQDLSIKTKNSANLLSNNDIASASTAFDNLASRSELASYTTRINAYKQDTIQKAADYQADKIVTSYQADYDVNKAFSSLQNLKNFGVNVDAAQSSVLQSAAKLKSEQLSGIMQQASELIANGTAPDQAIDQAVKAGAGAVLSPTQLVQKTETQIAQESAAGSNAGTYGTDPRTTIGSGAAKTGTQDVSSTPPPPVVTPQVNDLGSKYGIVGKTVYRKSDGYAFQNEQQFFADAGVSSFQNLKFDTAYTPPTPQASPQLNATTPTTPAAPTASATKYKVVKGDTLSAIAQRLLGNASKYTEIAKLNNIADPNKIQIGQELILPNK
jgi:nucleoid-associated protein YgaU